MSQEDINNKNALKNKEGIFGLGFSLNNNLDLLNLVVLACFGIIIKLFFQENYSKLGNIGPASTTIWGYGLTALSLFLMIFMSLYLTKATTDRAHLENNDSIFKFITNIVMSSTLPIVLTLAIVVYIIMLNFSYFVRINSNNVSDSYHVYSFFTSLLLILQIALIVKYMYNLLDKKNSGSSDDNKKETEALLIKSATHILSVVNFIFVLIIHILLAFFSTDG